MRNLDGSEKDLTAGKLKARFFSWARDLSAFYVETNERDPRFVDFYRYDAKTLERKLLFQNPARCAPTRRRWSSSTSTCAPTSG